MTVGVSDVTAGLVGCASSGECNRRVGADGGYFALDASNSEDHDMATQRASQFNYIWSCVPILGGTERSDLLCSDNDPSFENELTADSVRIQLDPQALATVLESQLVSGYKFTVVVRSTLYGMIREDSRALTVAIEPGSPPEVRISRAIALKSDTDKKASPNTQIVFRCTSDIDTTSSSTEAVYTWTSEGAAMPAGWETTLVSFDGANSMLALPAHTLTPGGTYTFICSGSKVVGGLTIADNSDRTVLVANAPPSSGYMNLVVGHDVT